MNEKKKKQEFTRRRFLKTASASAAAVTVGVPFFAKHASAAPTTIKIQSMWDAGTLGYTLFQEFAENVNKASEGKLTVKPFPAKAMVGTMEMFDAVKAGVFEAMHTSDTYQPGKIPCATFLASYPFGMDRPDQWETWFTSLGGKEIAREAYAAHNIYWIGPIQHDDNIIHSKVPIRSFEDYQGKKMRFPGGMIADIFRAAGVATVLLPGGEVYPALEKGVIDGADFVGAAINYNLGFGEVAKYIIMGPPSTPCLHQPVDSQSIGINMKTWKSIPEHLQKLFELGVKDFSWKQYTAVQKADIQAYRT
ncbi:MAG: TRAP transporter substrate-binding protein DctP, partial [Gammaproteobacteria bacterium]|nr:TRAP transporter substrate-binding protein DctP [Gammaproteobacteria bacterium]